MSSQKPTDSNRPLQILQNILSGLLLLSATLLIVTLLLIFYTSYIPNNPNDPRNMYKLKESNPIVTVDEVKQRMIDKARRSESAYRLPPDSILFKRLTHGQQLSFNYNNLSWNLDILDYLDSCKHIFSINGVAWEDSIRETVVGEMRQFHIIRFGLKSRIVYQIRNFSDPINRIEYREGNDNVVARLRNVFDVTKCFNKDERIDAYCAFWEVYFRKFDSYRMRENKNIEAWRDAQTPSRFARKFLDPDHLQIPLSYQIIALILFVLSSIAILLIQIGITLKSIVRIESEKVNSINNSPKSEENNNS